jgi:signal transduction histidine kinase/HAMP domain-containing protein
MAGPLSALSYRDRLTFTVVAAAFVPLVALALALGALSNTLHDQADRRLSAAARALAVVADGRTHDPETAARLAAQSGLGIALYAPDGTLEALSDPALAGPALGDPRRAAGSAAVQDAGMAIAVSAIGDPAAPSGYVAVIEPLGTLEGLDPGTVTAVAAVVAFVLAVLTGWVLARVMVQPLGRLSKAVARLGSGRLDERLPVEGGDELAAVAASHNRLADALAARNRSLALVLQAIAGLAPSEGVERLLAAAPAAAMRAFGFVDARVALAGTDGGASTMVEDQVPGEVHTFPTLLRAGDQVIGTLWTSIPPARVWGQADQDLLELFAIELGAAIRNAQLFAEVERLSETKSEFLRGVSHNLQTPLTSIHAAATRLAEEEQRANGTRARRRGAPDRRIAIIVEQSERLSRLVAQLLTVSRLEAGTLRPRVEVFAPAPLVRRAWESLGSGDDGLVLHDQAPEWLAAADQDRVDEVLWALLDNALKYGRPPVEVTVRPGEPGDRLPDGAWLVVAVRDHGVGILEEDRARVFERFTRLEGGSAGTGLGLPVARGLVEAMGGRLWIALTEGPGATFAFCLPAERIEEA